MVTGDDWGQKQAEGAQEVGEGTLFWLTAYLQLGNCILKYFNLSNIYKYVIGNLTATITLTSLWPVPVLSPTFLPVGSQFRESPEPVPRRQSPALTALGTGVRGDRPRSPHLLRTFFPSAQKAHRPAGEKLASAFSHHFRAVQFQGMGLLCTRRLGSMAPLLG